MIDPHNAALDTMMKRQAARRVSLFGSSEACRCESPGFICGGCICEGVKCAVNRFPIRQESDIKTQSLRDC